MTVIPETPTPPPTVHDIAAAKILSDVQTLVQNVRGFGFITRGHRRRINPTATVPTEFLLAVAVALDASEKLRNTAEITGDQIRDVVAFCNAYEAAANDLMLKAVGLQDTVKTQRGSAGDVCLRVYRLSRDFNKGSDKELFFPHIENMKRALGRGRKKNKKSDPAVEPAKKA